MRKPDILCIGAQKAGTTWFHVNFGARDDIWVPPFKELHYFDYHFAPDSVKWAPQHVNKGVKEAIRKHVAANADIDLDYIAYLIRIQGPQMFTRKWYREIFERVGDGQKSLDVTPEYSCISEEGVEFVRKFLPETQFLWFIRDPVARAISQIRMNLKRKAKVPETRAEWLRVAKQPVIEVRGDYANHVPLWRDAFDEDRLLFMPFGMISAAPEAFMARVETFLGLPPATYPNAAKKVHWAAEIAIPDYVRDYLTEATRSQRAFLETEFGREFCAQI
ncbi:sulfotransferase [Phaeovulum sp.]|uniref:sulfotransferase n=1 Tax=Phaeovulum sp. TaxID=2934796 RepID=UPI003561FE3A